MLAPVWVNDIRNEVNMQRLVLAKIKDNHINIYFSLSFPEFKTHVSAYSTSVSSFRV